MDIVERLRPHGLMGQSAETRLRQEAADEIERLKEENKSHVDWISDLADNLIKAESKMSMQSKEIERLREALLKIYWETSEPKTWAIAERALDLGKDE